MERARHIAKTTASDGTTHIISAADQATAGKALRDKVPRNQHGQWKGVKGRANPIEILRKSDAGRIKELLPIRYGRMLQSPFAFCRGAAGVMASDLAGIPTTGAGRIAANIARLRELLKRGDLTSKRHYFVGLP
jgi:Uncharacterized protein conserved in bacteria (DUF2252)